MAKFDEYGYVQSIFYFFFAIIIAFLVHCQ